MAVTRITTPLTSVRGLIKDFDTCLSFDGVDDIVTYGTGNPFTSNFYISVWVYWNGLNGNYQTLFAKRDSYAADGLMFAASINPSGTFNIDSTGVNFVPFAYPFNKHVWTHLCWVHDVTNADELLYINGVIKSTQGPLTLGTKTNSLLSIGACQSPATDVFYGLMDDFVIGTVAPTAEEVLRMAKKSYYPTMWTYTAFDEGSGVTANDSSGNGRNGTITGATFENSRAPFTGTRSTI